MSPGKNNVQQSKINLKNKSPYTARSTETEQWTGEQRTQRLK